MLQLITRLSGGWTQQSRENVIFVFLSLALCDANGLVNSMDEVRTKGVKPRVYLAIL